MQHHAGLARHLGRLLNQARAGMNQAELATRMRCSGSKISRMLAGDRGTVPTWADLQLLMHITEVTPAQRHEITVTWEALRAHPPAFHERDGVLTAGEAEYYEAMQYADNVVIQSGPQIPILFRSREYQAAVMRSQFRTPTDWGELLARIQQPQNHHRKLSVVMCESALVRFRVPGFSQSLKQVITAHDQGASIMIYPLSAPLTRGMLSGFSILNWDDDVEAAQYSGAWSHQAGDWVHVPAHRALLEQSWHQLLSNATTASELPAIIERAQRQAIGVPWEFLAA